jgi:hypothetical protein
MKLSGARFGTFECNCPLAWLNDCDWLQKNYVYISITYKVQLIIFNHFPDFR